MVVYPHIMAFRQCVPAQWQDTGDWRMESLAAAVGQKQARAEDGGVQATLCVSKDEATFAFTVSAQSQQMADDDA
jgi:hypothetical protein